jgi:hypothetical protein
MNSIQWLFDIPAPFKGAENKDLVREMAQGTVNNIGGKYTMLQNWSVFADPNQVLVSCDAPVGVNGATLIAFGNNMWEQCCAYYLKGRGLTAVGAVSQSPVGTAPNKDVRRKKWWQIW